MYEEVPLVSQTALEIDLIPDLHPEKSIPKFESLFLPMDLPKETPHPRRQSLPTREGAEAAGAGELPRTNETEFPGGCPGLFGEGGEHDGSERAMPVPLGGWRGRPGTAAGAPGGRRGTCRAPGAAGTAGRWR